MPRMRSNKRIFTALALFAGIAVCAAPALAAQADRSSAGSGPVAPRFGVAKVADWAQRTERREHRRAERIRERRSGPFVPVVGSVDFGAAENGFGAARSGHTHAGQDMFAPSGTPVVAPVDARVLEIGADGGQGNYVYIYDPELDRTYVFMHLVEPPSVNEGESIQAGQQLGGVGCTGSCWGDHLHFEIREGSGYEAEAIDPLSSLRKWRSLPKPLG